MIGVAVAVATASGSALALPLPLSASAVAAPATGSDAPDPGASGDVPDPGSTRSLPLVPLAGHERSAAPGTRAVQGLPRRDVEPFSLVGVVWEEPDAELHGTVQVRTRSAATGAWSAWQDLDAHQHDHAADPGTAEARSQAVRGGTAPLWVGDSDGVEVRVRPEAPDERGAAPALPRGLRVELVDPGEAPDAAPGAKAEAGGPSGAGLRTSSRTLPGTASGVALGTAPGVARDDGGTGAGRLDAAPEDDAPHDDAEVDGPADDGTDTPADPTAADPTADTPTGPATDDTDPATDPDSATDPATDGADPASETDADPASGTGTDTDESPAEPAGTGQGAPAVALTAEESAASAVNADLASIGATEIPALTKAQTEEALADALADADSGSGTDSNAATGADATTAAAKPYIGPRPRIVTRKGWGADEKLREANFLYTKSVQAAFVHHSATGNNYTCAQAPSVLRGIYRYHVQSMGWRDLGYNFAVDKCGTIYEGRAGGVAKPVQGAHTLGFNANTTGIAVIGSFASTTPPAKAVTAVAKLTAWKLGLHGKNPRGKSTLTSGGGNLYKKGTKVQLNTISGHRDGYSTACPGTKLYGKLGTIRAAAADYQGRP
ncbi:N-acetylmuramoyl-L-alanine amidase [Streptomyces thermolilacinus SPC6]|uniref:N-acetylmuramoyl-L-alanine amidase n=1 Tax=Streptomyces thermolilacinus SPC6 TaxID=1306406 RepID=A0A1D3DUI5_9ACTN|nr:N-acetylmuramoyl-L-alanine amidase [Streptomyces thermolilacinus SPC6]